jgi:hypothetical protein
MVALGTGGFAGKLWPRAQVGTVTWDGGAVESGDIG